MTGILFRRGEEMRGRRQLSGDEGRGRSHTHAYKDCQQTAKVRRGGKDSPQAFRGSLANSSSKPPGLQTPASRTPVHTPRQQIPSAAGYFAVDSASVTVHTTISLHFLFVG